MKLKSPFFRPKQANLQGPGSIWRRLFKHAVPVKAGGAEQTNGASSHASGFDRDAEAGTIMLDVLIGLLIGTVGLCLVLGGIALTTWRAGYAKQDILKIIETRNERDKTNIFEINPDTFKKDAINLDTPAKD